MNNLRTPFAIFEGSSLRYPLLALSICWALLCKTALAGSATWDLNPTSGDWNTASNWTPETVPDESTDVATFSVSNVTTVSMSSYTFLGGLVFTPGASAFTIVAHGALQGAGVSNN